MEDYQAQLRDSFRATSIVGYSTSLSVIVYGVIANFLLSRHSGAPESDGDHLVVIFGGLGGVLFVALAFLDPVIRQINRPAEISGPAVIRQLQASAMVTFGVCETISILGLVLAVMTRDIRNYYWLAFLSLVAFAVYFPKYARWDRFLRDALYGEQYGEGA